MNEAFGEHFRVELLKDVLVFDVLEDDHHLVQRVLQFGLREGEAGRGDPFRRQRNPAISEQPEKAWPRAHLPLRGFWSFS